MNTSFLVDVEDLITWLFDHDEELIIEFGKGKLVNADNIFISGDLVFVRDNFIAGSGNHVFIPINDIIAWIENHTDCY